MWIRSQDKNELVKVIRVHTSRIFGDKKGKYILWGQFSGTNLFGENKTTLGIYPTEERLQEELALIESALKENPEGFYEMR
ncbi:MAG: hypothetical protein KBF03_05355 [Proteiniclasticum sp.]|uniref:hypothetical protein n=1 Tax=Proteiniclasticum ruminis TaxID=398199 RepID=UPI001B49DBDC|nr:hypothetical protein [Proteiniclasticum ruminis]MBP9921361.1 hypothetical protein [Proteiniclasticum sp.]